MKLNEQSRNGRRTSVAGLGLKNQNDPSQPNPNAQMSAPRPDTTPKRNRSIGWLFGAKHMTGEAGKYLAIQVIAYALEMTTFQIFVLTDSKLIAAGNVAGKLTAGVFAFLMHGSVTFRGSKSRSLTTRTLLYALVLAINSVFSTALLMFLVHTGLNATLAKLFADIILITGTFVIARQLIFARTR